MVIYKTIIANLVNSFLNIRIYVSPHFADLKNELINLNSITFIKKIEFLFYN